ncbi:MAG TPA: heavy metal translocating P-type ATPase [Puia sp.]|nr:heavy metal translocating P-type ATPase [Puia sp.]
MADHTIAKETYPVLNMSCASCAINVQSALRKQRGVVDASVNFAQKTAQITFDPALQDATSLRSAVRSAGYDLVIGKNAEQEAAEVAESRFRSLKTRTIIAVLLTIPLLAIGMFFPGMRQANIWMWVLSTPVVVLAGAPFFENAWRQARHGKANMDTLVALSTGVTWLFSAFNTLDAGFWLKRGIEPHVYFEAAATVVSFILIGRFLEERAKDRASSAIRKLMELQPASVLVIRDGKPVEEPVESVRPGDIILARPGERIAVDGVVVSGRSFIDESLLTGESVPVEKSPGAKVYAGTTNQQGSFQFRGEQVGASTRLAQIIRAVKEAQGSRAPVQRLVDKVAGVAVPIVIAIAVLSFLIWWAIGGQNGPTHGLLALVTVLVIACPCALGLATPTAIMVGIGRAATRGILIRDAEGLEKLAKVDTVVLDKTGTVTEGRPEVTEWVWMEGEQSEKGILSAIESHSDHPLAAAILRRLGNTTIAEVTNVENLPGWGIVANANGRAYAVGNGRLAAAEGIRLSPEWQRRIESWESNAQSIVYFIGGGKLIAMISISDRLKPTATAAVRALADRGIEVHLLTGDSENAARAVAGQLGIDRMKASALPDDKLAYIKNLQSSGRTVAMVGDGINDSAALVQSDVGIAMGKGADIAMDSARMTIISSDPSRLPEAIRLSARTVGTIRQNLFWAFIYNLIGIPVAAGILYPINGFLLNPMIAGAAMALSSVSVVTNSLRLKRAI